MSDIEVKSFRLQADMDGPLLNWSAKGFTVEYVGPEDVEGTAAYRLRIDTNQDIVMDFWFDTDSVPGAQAEHQDEDRPGRVRDADLPPATTVAGRADRPVLHRDASGRPGHEPDRRRTLEYGVTVDPAVFTMPAVAAGLLCSLPGK